MDEPHEDLSGTVQAAAAGDQEAAAALFPRVYERLRALAGSYMRGERAAHTLQPTALVHEAYMRMVDIHRIDWRSTSHFFAVAACQMRRILIEHARGVRAEKRGGGAARITLEDGLAVGAGDPLEILAIDEALEALSQRHARAARVAEMRVFAGMQVDEVAAELGVSERTVKGDWRLARAWLARALGAESGSQT